MIFGSTIRDGFMARPVHRTSPPTGQSGILTIFLRHNIQELQSFKKRSGFMAHSVFLLSASADGPSLEISNGNH